MASNRINITELDFDSIKNNLKAFLQAQEEFTDYDFDGSGLSVLLDILAYNTHYNAYYLNMVANESFLDTSLIRDSVVSHAKTLGYTPYSTTAARATVNLQYVTTNGETSLTLPRGFRFKSNLMDNISYTFVLLDDVTVDAVGNIFTFQNLPIYEGQLLEYRYVNNELTNPKSVFTLEDENVDTSTIRVTVQESFSNTSLEIYNLASSSFELDGNSPVFFLQEGRKGLYEIYFGNGVIGKKLKDGNIVYISYLATNGSVANGLSIFVPVTAAGQNFAILNNNTTSVSVGGTSRETIDEIKSGAKALFYTQNRLVTANDYEAFIKKAYPAVDSLSIWGGEQELPPVYGKVFISLKPKQDFFLSEVEKQRIVDEIIKPNSIVSIEAELRDPEYLYLQIENKVRYYKNKTLLDAKSLEFAIRSAILKYKEDALDQFGSTFVLSKMQDNVDAVDLNAILGSESTIRLEKRFRPIFGRSTTYTINFNAPLQRGTLINRLASTEFKMNDKFGVERTATIEEIPESFTGVSNIRITNAGYGYTTQPEVIITGDGFGAKATAKVVNGRIESIEITNRGTSYSRALITIRGGNGFGASAVAELNTKNGFVRTIYYNENAERQIINNQAGTIDYASGVLVLNDLNINSVLTNDDLIRVTVQSEMGIIKSTRNTIITIDENDTGSIVTELIAV